MTCHSTAEQIERDVQTDAVHRLLGLIQTCVVWRTQRNLFASRCIDANRDLGGLAKVVLQNPDARRKFIVFLQGQLGISAQEADTMLEHCANSFVGIFTTFDRRFRQRFAKADIERLLREINGEADERDDQAA
ncbi:hypothetical protein [Mesorhizobium sp. M0243]|uniref:hypothetical protein n=1 Tax=Mesorhizobium sp. M0243 TaxID=2956925 RepID=UPI00333B12B7